MMALEPQPPAWHDLSNPPGELISAANRDIEEIAQQYVGLNKGDFFTIQERLIFVAKVKAEVPESHECRNSLRRRQLSTTQSVS